MRQIKVETVRGISTETVYNINELSYLGKLFSCKESKKRGVSYLEIPCAFDIETTNIYQRDSGGNIAKDPRPFAFMYHWQFCLDDQVVFGRTWKEFQELLKALEERMNLSINHRLVVYVHNLPFEWAFMNRFIEYDSGFFKDERKPLKIVCKGGIEFRCSLALSNMSLAKFCENEIDVIHYKLSGDDYDYAKIRTPATTLTEYEEGYCYNDVRGLCECIRSRMKEDTLASIPMTSTGYVRRDLRRSCKQNKRFRARFKDNALDTKLYTFCREAFRGGDTHANLLHTDQLIKDVDSFDESSAYPAAMLMDRYPMSAFSKITIKTFQNKELMKDYALLIHVRFIGVRYTGKCGIPYIAIAKCMSFSKEKVIDNGRVLYADFLEAVLTDIDYNIIISEYDIKEVYVNEVYASRYGMLPEEIRSVVMDYYKAKTLLKGDDSKEYEYAKSKNKLNSTYGCMVMKIDQVLTEYDSVKHEYYNEPYNLEELLTKFYKSRNSFLSYQHGVWITANARRRLRYMLDQVGEDVVYCDTDSIKCIGDHRELFNKRNSEIIEECEKYGAYAFTKDGKKKYLGVWEYEGRAELFKTLGAKKYVYKKDDHITSTIAGVNKKTGRRFFEENGISAFKIGTVIPDSGHLVAYYNDDNIHTIRVKGCKIETASNVALIDDTYTIGVTEEYLGLLSNYVDKKSDFSYI